MTATYITTTIPYVNARPHIGHALELVQADVLARYHRGRGDAVRFQAGTDDNALKNVLAAGAAGLGVREFVDRNAEAFGALGGALSLSVDDFIRTSRDPRHRPGVEAFWRACSADLYRQRYTGLYCTGCEQFYVPAELRDGRRCPEHGTEPERVSEENWFFRLSRYAAPLREAITTGRLRIEPAGRRNEVLGLIDGGLPDFSVSRPAGRAGGWGIPVPGDPDQVVYVWFDALCNYVSALGYGQGGPAHSEAYRRWWAGPGNRVHLLGKGVLRFHAVYWPAMLLASGQQLPTGIFVHDYLTTDGQKISKSGAGAGATADGPGTLEPAALAAEYGADAVRWWLLREVPRVGDADFTVARLVARADDELANGLGNLVNRVVAMIARYRDGQLPSGSEGPGRPAAPGGERLAAACRQVGRRGRRRAGELRLPAGHGRDLEHRRRGERLRQPGAPLGTGQDRTGRRPAAARHGALPVAGRLLRPRPRADAIPARHGGPRYRPVHAGRRRAAAGAPPGVPAPGPAGPVSTGGRARHGKAAAGAAARRHR